MFGEIAALLREADFAFVNLEHALSRSGHPNKGKHSVHRGVPEMVQGIIEAGFDALSLANNHMLDYGEASLSEPFGTRFKIKKDRVVVMPPAN
jgi:poly-gamma-glutamate synthesis protein (capsule biosynthesis protein)